MADTTKEYHDVADDSHVPTRRSDEIFEEAQYYVNLKPQRE